LVTNWPSNVEEARECQLRLKDSVITHTELSEVGLVAGVDVGFENKGNITRAAVAVLSFPDLILQEQAIVRVKTRFPYIPGYLSFREAPAILDALKKLKRAPDIILCDGQGLAHPRRFGIASHLGVITGIPTIGVAKSRLIGDYEEPGEEKGDWSPLTHQGEIIGAVLRTRSHVKPLFISIGHKVDLKRAIKLVLQCTTRYRLPETTRWAHKLASG
jgi:deoxyribonuclease V